MPFSENVMLTKRVVEYAHPKNVVVEGEIGLMSSAEGGESQSSQISSSPEQTKQFVELTGVDSVAVSIGNEHGAPIGEKIDLKLLEEIANIVKIPLVLHGSSGLSDDDLSKAIKFGVAKINVDTLVRRAFINGIKNFPTDPKDYRDMLQNGMKNVEEIVENKIKFFQK